MKSSSKRTLSRILSFVMLVSAMCTNLIVANAGSKIINDDDVISGSGADVVLSANSVDLASSGTGPISVWDFGGVEESDASLYTNYISTAFLDAWTEIGDEASGNQGKFINGGTFDLSGGLSLTTNANDRMYYLIDEAGTQSTGLRSYGANSKAITAYDDGYTANGMWYANGTGGDTRRFMQIDNVEAGSEIKVYTGSSNASDTMVEFTYLGSDGTQAEEVVFDGGACNIAKFIAKYSGSYKVWFSAAGGKPIVNRIVMTPPITVTANIDLASLSVGDYSVEFKNNVTEDSIDATVANNTATAKLTPGYSYTAILKGAVGFGFTSDSKTVDVTIDDLKAGGKAVVTTVETKETYVASGKVEGFETGYDTSKFVLTFVPEEGSTAEKVVATVDAGLNYNATLEPDVVYTAEIAGVNDYEVTANGTISGNGNMTQNITVSLKATYTVTGNIVGGATVTGIAFVNVEDGYSYGGSVSGDTYTVILRDGSYEVQAVAEGYSTTGHIVVEGKNTSKDILFVPTVYTPPTVDTSVRDIYVGCEGQVNNYSTVGEALEAAKVMAPTSEAERVTIHIAPGTYREQISVETPYITFVSEGNGDVVLTWYYGIGYNYYSIDKTGYYNEENAFDKYEKNTPAKWGVGTYVKKGADGFKAENITFEASFNKYITDEEISDGVTETGALPVRNYALDVTSKAATERSTAICVESNNTEFKNCKFIGSQDTLYMGDSTHTYYKNCVIEGNTDYIFGSGSAVFDGCELRFCGYSDTAMGGYITAGRSNNATDYKGYLFRACTITNKDGMKHAGGYYGRPWDAGADITFLNTTIEESDAITAVGWTSMSGVSPESAKFKEYGTMLADGTSVDTTGRVAGTVLSDADVAGINAIDYFAGWTPTYYVEDTLPVEFATTPYFSTDGDVLLPATGNTFVVKYSIGANDVNDASKITYSICDDVNGTNPVVVKSTTAAANSGVKLTNDMIGKFLMATVTPCTVMGNVGTAVSIVTEKEITLGSGSIDTERPSGKAVVFLAGDSTVKDYSAGAINNSGANRPEGSWGEYLGYFVNDNYEVMNYAQGGRSSRTFIDGTSSGNDKYLDKIKEQMVAGDYLFIQFGHNDSSASYADRYVPVGTPDANGVFPLSAPSAEGALDGTFKWYLQQYVDAAKAVGATPVMVTPVSRMYFNADGTIKSHHGDNDEYVTATKQIAEENGIECIDLYTLTKNMYEDAYKVDGANGESTLAYRLFAAGEKTHHSKLGGFAIASDLAKILKNSSLGLSNAIVTPKTMFITDDKGNAEFTVNNSGVFTGYGRNDGNVFDVTVPCTYWDNYINSVISDINSIETTTESTTEVTTTEPTTGTPVEDGVISITPVVTGQTDSTLTVAYKVAGNTLGFNNYTMYFTFDSNVLRPSNVEDGDISIDVVDATGNNVKEYASNSSNIMNQLTDVPATGNTNFPGADGIKTQAELGKIKVSYCIFDKSFAEANSGSLPKFTGEGTLFTVTYDVTGELAGTTLGMNVGVINAVSSDLNIASTPTQIISGSYTFEGGETTESTTSEATTEATTEDANSLDKFFDSAIVWDIKAYQANADMGNGLTAISEFEIKTDGAKEFYAKDGSSYVYSKAMAEDNCIAATSNNDAIKFVAPSDGKFKIAFKVNSGKNGSVFGEEFTMPSSSTYYYREYDVVAGQTYTAGLISSKIRIFYLGFTPSGDTPTTEATTSVVTEATTEATTSVVTEATTEATTNVVTEATTEATTVATTETPSETTTRRQSSSGSSGAGASSIKVSKYTSTTTEATTEATTEDSTVEATEVTTASSIPSVEVAIGSNEIVINGNEYTIDATPYIQASSNSTMVPLRFVTIALLGGDVENADESNIVEWDAVNKKATINYNGNTIVFTAGSNIIEVNGVEKSMDYGVIAEIVDGRMYVPFRAIGEALGVDVDWDATSKTAYYNKED